VNRALLAMLALVGLTPRALGRDGLEAVEAKHAVGAVHVPRAKRPRIGLPGTGGFRRACLRARARGRRA